MVLDYQNYKIELCDYKEIGGNKDTSEYGGDDSSSIKHTVVVRKKDEVLNSVILFGNEGPTSIHSKSAIVFDDMLIVCVSNKVFCLALPTLNLIWEKEIDEFACLAIYKTSESYLVHGEQSITRITFDGDIIWQFSGEDIFVSKDGADVLKFTATHIELVDWSGKLYRLGYDGRELYLE